MKVYAVHYGSLYCGENETQLFSTEEKARKYYNELLSDVDLEDEDIEVLEQTENELYIDDDSTGVYNRFTIEELEIQ
jgi:hypothetical protein